MSSSSRGIRVPRSSGEHFRRALIELGCFDPAWRVRSEDDSIFLPVKEMDEAALAALRRIGEFDEGLFEFREDRRRITVEEILGRSATFEIVGDIAIVEDEEPEEAASAILSAHKSIKTVIAPVSDVEGEFRTRRFRHLAGEARTTTIHKENGLRYRIDLEQAYFTPRLGTERLRVADQVRPGQVVLDMFAGVGPFSLLSAKRGAHVIAIDKNPAAVRLLLENAAMNRLELTVLEGDSADLCAEFQGQADHVIMNLPHSASEHLPAAITAAKDGGVVHYYAFAPEGDLYRDVALIEDAASAIGATVKIAYRGVVRSYSPHMFNVVMDCIVTKI